MLEQDSVLCTMTYDLIVICVAVLDMAVPAGSTDVDEEEEEADNGTRAEDNNNNTQNIQPRFKNHKLTEYSTTPNNPPILNPASHIT